MRLVIITGMSGAGKSQALNILEDMDYYCIDNLPPMLLDEFVTLCNESKTRKSSNIAVGIDIRGGEFFREIQVAIEEMKNLGIHCEILFLDANDEVLISRYQESRRTHPLSRSGRVQDGISRERKILNDIKETANYIIDTTNMSIWQLKRKVTNLFLNHEQAPKFPINILSFGFKHGIPNDADLVFDVRFIDNPYYIKELREHTGLDADVHDYVMGHKEAQEFLKKLIDMVDYLLPLYMKEGKGQLSIAIGCTGGKHRSVTIAEELAEYLKSSEYMIIVDHINIHK